MGGFDRMARVFGWVAVGLATLAATGWVAGLRELASFGPDYKPMAPTTVVALLALGAFVIVASGSHGAGKRASAILPAFSLLWVLAAWAERLGWLAYGPARLMSGVVSATSGSAPTAMAWMTMAGLAVLSTAALLVAAADRLPTIVRSAGTVALWICALVESGIALAYLYGMPPFYGGPVIPVSFPTSIAATFLAVGMIVLLGADRFPLNVIRGDRIAGFVVGSTLLFVVLAFILPSVVRRVTPGTGSLTATLLLGGLLALLLLGSVPLVAGQARRVSQMVAAADADQTEALKAASEAAERWETFFQAIGDPVLIIDAECTIAAANRAAVASSGRPESELVGSSCREIYCSRETPPRECPIAGFRDSELAETHGREVESAAGTFVVSCTPIFDGSGQLSQVIHIATDITKRVVAERAREQSRALLQSLVDATSDAIYVKDLEGRYLLFNRSAESITGKASGEILGKDDTLLFPAEEAEIVMAGDRAVMEAGVPKTYEEHAAAADGTRHHYLSTKGPVFDGDGRPYGLFGIARDITERKAAEAQLEALASRQEAILGAVPDIIAEVDSNKVYTWMNEAGLGFFGRDAIGHEASDYFLGEQDTYFRVEPLFHGSSDTIYVESWQRRFDGEKRLLGWWCRVLTDASGAPAGALSTARDITERRAFEDELALHREHLEELVDERTEELTATNEELDSSNEELAATNEELAATNEELIAATAAKDEFLASMSHELRTPLNSVIGFSGLLLSGAAGPLNDEQQKQTGMIASAGSHLLSLIDDLLDIKQVESGRVDLAPEDLDPAEIMTAVVESIQPLADEKGLELRSDVLVGTESFFGDRRVIAQVLMNLCANAVRYTDSGSVSIGCRTCADGGLEYEVTDTGSGIAGKDQERIFGEFVRLDRRESGTGLGLPLSRRLARAHGGDVTVRSVVGEGSVFIARFESCPSQDA